MNRVPVVFTYFITLLMLAGLTGIVGCAHGDEGTAPVSPGLTEGVTLPDSPTGQGVTLGCFQFVWDDDGTVRVEEASAPRGADLNVTSFASIVIESFFFNEDERNWYITATLKNISPFTGYDVWAVFHSLGNKFVINQDGFLWANPPIFPVPTRCAFIAYGKDQPDRVFPPLYKDTRTIVIHQPEGIPKLAPLGFWIDATINPRKTPGVEDLEVEPIDETNYHLTGYIWDHQSPSEELTAIADMTDFNGNPSVPLFDDGEHGDGDAGDGIWGCDFSGDPEDGLYVITVYAFDPQGNQGENDVGFWHGEDEPCDEPLEFMPFNTIDKGEHSGIQEYYEAVINDPETWERVWQDHMSWIQPSPPPPPIDFERHTVLGIWIGERPSNNHHATITEVYYDPCEDLVTAHYDYTPYEACGPLDVITHPFHIVILPKFDWPVYFAGHEVPCPGPPPECVEEIDWGRVLQGTHSGIHLPYELRIKTERGYDELWEQHTSNMWPPPERPEVNFEEHDLVVLGLGDRPTGGFECVTEKVCWLPDETIGVFYIEEIPGPDCEVEQVITQPFDWIVIPKFDADVKYFHRPHVYSCGSSDCEQPLISWPIDSGDHTGHSPGEFVFRNPDDFGEFWAHHKPGHPMPPVRWEEEMVLAMLIGERRSTGFYVTTEEVCLNGLDDPDGPHIDATFVEHVPGENCNVLWIITEPYQIIVVPRFDVPVNFHLEEVVYDCPPVDCVPVDFWTRADGEQSCEPPGHFPMFNQDALEDVWNGIHCEDPDAPPPPEIDWREKAAFVIQTAGFDTTGFYVTIDEACVDVINGYVRIDWTVNIPGANCPVEPVDTKPWVIGTIRLKPGMENFDWDFVGHEEVYECPPCVEVPWYQIDDGEWSCADAGTYGFAGFNPEFEELWSDIHCGDPPPVPPIPDPVEGGEMKPFVVQLNDRPTTGWYLTIDHVCLDGCDAWVTVTEWRPGETCDVEQDTTRPWVFGVAEFPPIDCEIDWHFEWIEEEYQCDDCNPVPFWELVDGDDTCAEPGEYGFQYLEDYEEFWYAVNCVEPGDPPPPLPEDPEPTQEGIIYHFGIQLGERPTAGYYMEINDVCIEGCDVYIDYTEWIPGENCEVDQVVTMPWLITAVELPPVYCYWTWHFEKHEEVYDCPDPCFDFERIAGNNTWGGQTQGGWYFDNPDDYDRYWMEYHPDLPQPAIDFDGGWGGYAVHLGVRETTGFELEVYEVCPADDPFGVAVRWIEWIPGETCDVEPEETAPWTVVTFPLVDLPYYDEGIEEVYECG